MSRNKFKKYFYVLTIAFAFVFSFQFALAQDDSSGSLVPERPTIQVEIGDFGSEGFSPSTPESCYGGSANCVSVSWISEYIAVLYQYGIGVAGFLAVLMIMIGGFVWLVSAGSPGRISQAKDFITSALLGLLLALFSYVILLVVNPRLVETGGITIATPAETAEFIPPDDYRNQNCCVCQTVTTGGLGAGIPSTYCTPDAGDGSCAERNYRGTYHTTSCSVKVCATVRECIGQLEDVGLAGKCRRDDQCLGDLICIDGARCGNKNSVPSGGDCNRDIECISGKCNKPWLSSNTCE